MRSKDKKRRMIWKEEASLSSGEDPVGHSSSEGNGTQMLESGQKQKAER